MSKSKKVTIKVLTTISSNGTRYAATISGLETVKPVYGLSREDAVGKLILGNPTARRALGVRLIRPEYSSL
jgi:hypothetical protein